MNHHPLEPLIKEYLEDKDITKETLKLYSTILKQYLSYLKDHQIILAQPNDLIAYHDWKRSQGYSIRWLYLQMSTIKGFYRYLCQAQKRLNLPADYATDITASLKNEHMIEHQSHSVLTIEQAALPHKLFQNRIET